MAYLVYNDGSEDCREAIPIVDKGCKIGRHSDNDITILEDVSTSRWHCEIRRPEKSSRFVLQDLGSSNGTYVNSTHLSGKQIELNEGDSITVGRAEFTFHLEQQDYQLTTTTSIIVKQQAGSGNQPQAAPPPPTKTETDSGMLDTVKLDRKTDMPPELSSPTIDAAAKNESKPLFAPGTIIEGYEIIRPVGSGSHATVYLVNQGTLRRTVAMKVFQIPEEQPEIFEKFTQQIQIAGKIQHPNITSYIDTIVGEDFCSLTMNYVPEGNMSANLAAKSCMPENAVIDIIVRLAYAIELAQNKFKLIHYDIKPANIFFTDTKDPVIADFGLAPWVAESFQINRKTYFGTPAYMPPEQTLDKACDWSCDMYSLGIVFYEMLVGHPPFEADTSYRLIEKQIKEPVRFPKQLKISENTRDTIRRMTEKKPADRFPDWQRMIRQLEKRKSSPSGRNVMEGKVAKSNLGAAQKTVKTSGGIKKVAGKKATNIKIPGKKGSITLRKIVRK